MKLSHTECNFVTKATPSFQGLSRAASCLDHLAKTCARTSLLASNATIRSNAAKTAGVVPVTTTWPGSWDRDRTALLAALLPRQILGRSCRLRGDTEFQLPICPGTITKSFITAAKKVFDYYHAYYENRTPSPPLSIWAGNKTAIDAFEQASEPE
jgi:hypothetical protein